MNRRTFLKGTLTRSTIAVAAAAGLLKPSSTLAADWPSSAFRARSVSDALNQLFKTTRATPNSAVTIAAPIQNSSRVVPISVTSQLKEVESIAIVVENNVCPLSTLIRTPKAGYFYSCHIKMAKTSAVTAYVNAGGKLYSNSTTVKINVGGYGMHGELATEKGTSTNTYPTKLRTRKNRDGETEILVLVNHPMSGGQGRDPSKACFSGHFIKMLTFVHNGILAAEALLGPGVAKNPLTGIVLPNAKAGDTVTVKWVDNKGQHGGGQVTVR